MIYLICSISCMFCQKGGHCIYSGRPQQLSLHLSDCDIHLSKAEFPIEVLLKYSCNDITDNNVKQMVEKIKEKEKASIETRSTEEIAISLDGIQKLSKRFYFHDLWLLLERGMTYTFQFYWKILLIQLIIYLYFGVILRILFNPNIGIPSGCVSYDDELNNTCAKTETKLEEEERLISNLKFNYYLLVCLVIFTTTGTILSFSLDMKIFLNEKKNGMKYIVIVS